MSIMTDPLYLADRMSSLEEIVINLLPVPAHPDTTFDDADFRAAVARSMSLMPDEKAAIIAAVPSFSQDQVDGLLAIFAEESATFGALLDRAAAQGRSEAEARRASARRSSFTLIHGEKP